jgi:hypothetical protein
VRGTLKEIEVERWGGEQAHRRVGSLKPLQDLHNASKLSGPASAPFFFVPIRLILPNNPANSYSVFETYLLGVFPPVHGLT